jgi:hypothetical protein
MSSLFGRSWPYVPAQIQGRSLAGWILDHFAWTEIFVLLSGLVILWGACKLVSRRRPAAALAAYMVFLPLPLMIAICGILKGMVSSFVVLATADVPVKTTEWFGGWASLCFSLLFACLVTAPSYFVLAFGLLSRTLQTPPDQANRIPVPSESPQPPKMTDRVIPGVT